MSNGKEAEDRRMFELEDGGKFFIAGPTAEDIRLSDWTYSKTYNKALVEGIATAIEMEEALKKRGILGDEYDTKVESVKDTIGKKIVDMELSSDKVERKELAEEVAKLREELFSLNQRVNGPMSNSIENISDDARLECLTSCIVEKEDGTKIWTSYDEYLVEKNRDLAFRARFEVLLFLQGLDADFLDKAPERIVLREMAKAAIVEEEKDLVEADEAAEEAPEVKKKRAYKKKATPAKKKVVKKSAVK